MNTELVKQQVEDWIVRLNQLYDKIDRWLVTIPHDRTRRETLKQSLEPRMREFHVPARDVPTYTIFKGNRRISFVPSALWVPGTNGRINLTTIAKQHILVDRSHGENGSNWQLVTDNFTRPLIPFNKAQLLKLLSEGE